MAPHSLTLALPHFVEKGYLILADVSQKVVEMADNSPAREPGNDKLTVDAEQIADLREQMLRFATLQLRDATLAEDAVHNAIDAALSSSQFSARGSVKSWVFAILRNKIIDIIRERSRHPTESFTEDDGSDLDDQFNDRGHWKKTQKPSDWGDPETTLANEQFWLIFEACLTHLADNTARVFMMHEHLGLAIKEICHELAISEANCWVIMHRARMRLRICLENNLIGKNFLQAEQ